MGNSAGQVGSSLGALMNEYTSIAHNLANVSTAGFKRNVNSFSSELMKKLGTMKEKSLNAAEIDSKTSLDFSQGPMLVTGRTLDVAISGKGFFVLESPEGPVYTRNGSFLINPTNGQLVDSGGRLVSGADGPIVIPPEVSMLDINISQKGDIEANGATIGKLKVMDFGDDEYRLISAGDNGFSAPARVEGVESKDAVVMQGYKEGSNVKAMEELVNLMTVSRLYESNMGILRKRRDNADAILGVANG